MALPFFSATRPTIPRPMVLPAILVGLVLLGLAGNVVAWFAFGLLPDEAYYWAWSQRLAWGYFDHAPLVAWLIRPFAALGGDAAWAIRLPAVLSWLVGGGVAYALGVRLFASRRAGGWAFFAWSSLPLTQGGFHIVTPDAPLIIFGGLTYWCAARALEEGRWWAVAGAMAGLTMLGKYTGLLVPAGILLALLFSPAGRALLRSPAPWVAALIAAVLVLPMVIWNRQNDWVSFAFQFQHGVAATPAEPLRSLALFVGGQLGIAMPWTLLAMAFAAVRPTGWPAGTPEASRHMLVVGFWLPLLVFGAAGFSKAGQANWPAMAYLPGSVLLGGALAHWTRAPGRGRPWLGGGIAAAYLVGLLVTNLVRYPQLLPAAGFAPPPGRSQLTYSYGWDQVARELAVQLRALPRGSTDCGILTERYQIAAMVTYLLGQVGRVTVIPGGRPNQFHLWHRTNPLPPEKACLLVWGAQTAGALPALLAPAGVGVWRRVQVLELRSPDLSRRWVGFYRPAGGEE